MHHLHSPIQLIDAAQLAPSKAPEEMQQMRTQIQALRRSSETRTLLYAG